MSQDTKLNLNLNLNLNLREMVLFYLSKLYEESGGSKMTLEQLQADIKAINALLDAIQRIFPGNSQFNNIIDFLQTAAQDPLLANIILLILNATLKQKELQAKLLAAQVAQK